MEQRRSIPWPWVLVTLGLLVVVAAIAYYLGAHHRFGLGAFGFWLPVLLLALVVGVVVAAIARPRPPTMTFEEWHRRAHGEQATTAVPGAGRDGGEADADSSGPTGSSA
jgi:hypothetical protein